MLSLFSNRHPLALLDTERASMVANQQNAISAISPAALDLLAQPYPSLKTDIADFSITVLDIETSGLKPQTDHIVSMGWVNIVDGVIKLSSAQHHIIYSPTDSTDGTNDDISRSLHHILPEQQQRGITLDQAMANLFESMNSPIILAHGSTIEKRFFEQYYRSKSCPNLPLIWLDTLKIEQNTSKGRNYHKDFRLFALRNQYQLPDYPAHHALMDAMATAELFLAQKYRLFHSETAPIGVLHQYSL